MRMLGRGRTELTLVLLVVVFAGVLVHPYRAQQASRYALTAAVVERGTILLDAYEDVLGIDRAIRDGHIYSDKAPGQPFLAVPFFAIGKAVGVEDATALRVDENLGLWWVTFWSAVMPGAILLVLMYRRVKREFPEFAVRCALAMFLGSLLLPFSSLLFGHLMAAVFLFGAYSIMSGSATRWRFLLAGFLAGTAVLVEYPALLGVVVLIVYALVKQRRMTLPMIAGGVVPAAVLAIYNQIAFGSPFTISYQFNAFRDVAESARPMFRAFRHASLDNLLRLLFEGRGLLIATPVVLVAVAGAVWRLRKMPNVDAAMALAMFGVFVLLPIVWSNPWGGDSPGPRYLTPAIPFLAVPLAWAWQRWHVLTLGAVTVSVATMTVATLSDPLLGVSLGTWVRLLVDGNAVPTLWTMVIGGWGWLLYGLVGAGVVALLVRANLRGLELASTHIDRESEA